jgi:uncharacterized membrane protein
VIEPIAGSSRRTRFRAAVADLSDRSSSNDLIRWMLVPGSVAVLLGFVVMTLGWVGASHTARQIEQIPYLISGGLIGLALVLLGGILLAATFSAAVLRKVQEEADTRAATTSADLADRVAALEATTPARRPRRAS